MKATIKTHFKIICSALILGTVLVACSTDDNSDQNNDNTQEIIEANSIATSGNWRVTNYTDDGQNETSDYNGYSFTFESGGTIVASNGTTEIQGTWSISEDEDNSNDDSDDDSDIDFNILFAVPDDSDFDDLSDDWDIVSISDTTINLRDVSGGDGSVDLLTFSKI